MKFNPKSNISTLKKYFKLKLYCTKLQSNDKFAFEKKMETWRQNMNFHMKM